MMTPRSVALVLALLATMSPRPARAYPPFVGFIGQPGCTGLDPGGGADGELIAIKRTPTLLDPLSFTFDLRNKGGATLEGTHLGDVHYMSWGWWMIPHGPSDTVKALITLPPAPGRTAPRVLIAHGDRRSVDHGVTIPMEIGNSLPVGVDRGIGLEISPSGSTSVNFGTSVRQYPERGSDGSVTIAFAPLADANRTFSLATCTYSGHSPPFDPASWRFGWAIRGYAIYRLPDTGAAAGPAEFTAALRDGDPATGFVAFIDLEKFRLDVACDVTVDPTVNDLDPDDGASLHDPDGVMYTGDEVLLWTDAATGPLAHPLRAPHPDMRYRYAIQPAAEGSFSRLPSCHGHNCMFAVDYRRDLDGNGFPDSINLDPVDPADMAVEFISPQADPSEGGQPGFGLTWRSQLLVSAVVGSPDTPTSLRRSTQISSLGPPLTPPLSSTLPLDIGDEHVAPFASGDVDPDPDVIGSSAYPLVFYSVPGQTIRLRIVPRGPTRHVQVDF